jgi:hypothetical protein
LEERELNLLYNSGKRIHFEGFYELDKYTYTFDFNISGLLVQLALENSICTLFRIDKQGNCLNEIKSYFSNNVDVIIPIVKKFLSV